MNAEINTTIDGMLGTALSDRKIQQELSRQEKERREKQERLDEDARIKARKRVIAEMLDKAQENLSKILKKNRGNKGFREYMKKIFADLPYQCIRTSYTPNGEENHLIMKLVCKNTGNPSLSVLKSIEIAITMPCKSSIEMILKKDIASARLEILIQSTDHSSFDSSWETCNYYDEDGLMDQALRDLSDPKATIEFFVRRFGDVLSDEEAKH